MACDQKTVEPSKHRLDRDKILDAGADLIERDGPEGLTMRRLADELDVTATAIYYYFAGRDALVEAIVDESCAAIVNQMPSSGSWSERLGDLMTAFVRRGDSHPSVMALAITRYAKLAPVMRVHDAVHEVLAGAGFTTEQATQLKALLFRYAVGHQAIEAIPDDVEWDTVSSDDYAHYVAARSAHDAFDGAGHFRFGLDVLFAGFDATLS